MDTLLRAHLLHQFTMVATVYRYPAAAYSYLSKEVGKVITDFLPENNLFLLCVIILLINHNVRPTNITVHIIPRSHSFFPLTAGLIW